MVTVIVQKDMHVRIVSLPVLAVVRIPDKVASYRMIAVSKLYFSVNFFVSNGCWLLIDWPWTYYNIYLHFFNLIDIKYSILFCCVMCRLFDTFGERHACIVLVGHPFDPFDRILFVSSQSKFTSAMESLPRNKERRNARYQSFVSYMNVRTWMYEM